MSTSGKEDPVYEDWLNACVDEAVNMSSWEEGFIADLADRFERGFKSLTDRQAEILERIYTNRVP